MVTFPSTLTLRLLWDNALRRNEICSLDVGDFDKSGRLWGQMSICTETYAKAENVTGQTFQLLVFLSAKIGESQNSRRTN